MQRKKTKSFGSMYTMCVLFGYKVVVCLPIVPGGPKHKSLPFGNGYYNDEAL